MDELIATTEGGGRRHGTSQSIIHHPKVLGQTPNTMSQIEWSQSSFALTISIIKRKDGVLTY